MVHSRVAPKKYGYDMKDLEKIIWDFDTIHTWYLEQSMR